MRNPALSLVSCTPGIVKSAPAAPPSSPPVAVLASSMNTYWQHSWRAWSWSGDSMTKPWNRKGLSSHGRSNSATYMPRVRPETGIFLRMGRVLCQPRPGTPGLTEGGVDGCKNDLKGVNPGYGGRVYTRHKD